MRSYWGVTKKNWLFIGVLSMNNNFDLFISHNWDCTFKFDKFLYLVIDDWNVDRLFRNVCIEKLVSFFGFYKIYCSINFHH